MPDADLAFVSAILPGMAAKLSIAIVGSGSLGAALAVSLHEAGYKIQAIVARSEMSIKKARDLARRVEACAVLDLAEVNAGLIWLCVPDSEIARLARGLAEG